MGDESKGKKALRTLLADIDRIFSQYEDDIELAGEIPERVYAAIDQRLDSFAYNHLIDVEIIDDAKVAIRSMGRADGFVEGYGVLNALGTSVLQNQTQVERKKIIDTYEVNNDLFGHEDGFDSLGVADHVQKGVLFLLDHIDSSPDRNTLEQNFNDNAARAEQALESTISLIQKTMNSDLSNKEDYVAGCVKGFGRRFGLGRRFRNHFLAGLLGAAHDDDLSKEEILLCMSEAAEHIRRDKVHLYSEFGADRLVDYIDRLEGGANNVRDNNPEIIENTAKVLDKFKL